MQLPALLGADMVPDGATRPRRDGGELGPARQGDTMQAILTRILPATNTKPTRIKAECARGSLIYSTTHLSVELGSVDAHRLAATALCEKFVEEDAKKFGPHTGNPWAEPFVSGSIISGDYVHVFTGGKIGRAHV